METRPTIEAAPRSRGSAVSDDRMYRAVTSFFLGGAFYEKQNTKNNVLTQFHAALLPPHHPTRQFHAALEEMSIILLLLHLSFL